MLILALDLGTSSCRSALFDERGRRYGTGLAQQKYSLQTGLDGKAELDPQTVLTALKMCLEATLQNQAEDRELSGQPIAAVGGSCFGHSLIGINQAGEPLTPIYTWMDTRNRQVAAEMRTGKVSDEKSIHQRSGCMLRASYWPAKLRWLAQTDPKLFGQVRYWVSPAEWIYFQLCGELRTAHGMITGSGLYNPSTRSYDAALLELAGVAQNSLPVICDDGLGLREQYARDWPTLREARWFPAILDGVASNLGSGATTDGCAAINVGTSAAIRIMKKGDGPAPFGLFRYRVDVNRYLIGGAISNAGNLREWALKELRLPTDPTVKPLDKAASGPADSEAEAKYLEGLLAGRPTPDHGLLVLPFWTLERSPDWREDVSGTVFGIKQSTHAIDIYQAIIEGSYQRLAKILDLLPDVDGNTQFLVGGGIQKSASSLQRLADVLGRPLTALDEAEASLRGAAVFALEKLGNDTHVLPVTGHTVQPDVHRMHRYAEERQRLAVLEAAVFPQGSAN